MSDIDIIPQNRRGSRLTKTFDLKQLPLPEKNEQNIINNFRKRQSYKTTRNYSYKGNFNIFYEEKTNENNKLKAPILNQENENIKNIINKNINNTISQNIFYQKKRIYYSKSKFKSNDNLLFSDGYKINIKDEEKYKLFNSNFQSQTIDSNSARKNRIKSFINFSKNKNKKDPKKLFINNQRDNEKFNFNFHIDKSVKHHTTIQSTISTFVPALSPKNDSNLIRKKMFKQNTNQYNNKKTIRNFIFSKTKNDNLNKIHNFNYLINSRKKYPFIANPNPILPTKYIDLPACVLKMNEKYLNILKKENDKAFKQYFSIIPKEKFSKKFQNIASNYDIKEKKASFKNDEIKDSEEEGFNKDLLIKENIISGKKLLKEINIIIKKNNLLKPNKKILFNKFNKYIILLNSRLKMMSVYLKEIIATYKIPKTSFGYSSTHELFFAIRTRNYILSSKILDNYKYIVLDFDYFNMTPLHWAAKYNFYQIIPKLIEYGANIDEQNYIGDTPLLISVKHKYIESVLFLLLCMASPFIKDNKGLGIFDYSKSEFKMISIFKKIISLHYASILGPTKNKYSYIQSRFIEYIINENKNDLEIDAYNLIKEKHDIFKKKKEN